MESQSLKNDSTHTTYIKLDTKICNACWKCLSECKNNVISRINLPWHKHARFTNYNDCTGCLKCMKICESGALMKV